MGIFVRRIFFRASYSDIFVLLNIRKLLKLRGLFKLGLIAYIHKTFFLIKYYFCAQILFKKNFHKSINVYLSFGKEKRGLNLQMIFCFIKQQKCDFLNDTNLMFVKCFKSHS